MQLSNNCLTNKVKLIGIILHLYIDKRRENSITERLSKIKKYNIQYMPMINLYKIKLNFTKLIIFYSIIFFVNKISASNINFEHPIYIDNSLVDFPKINLNSKNNTFHLFSHGRPSELFINGEWKNAFQIVAFLKPQIINSKSSVENLNIYGCEFAKGEKGTAAVKYLEKELGIIIAASNNITGKGGDWNLEVGEAVNVISLENYDGNLQACPLPAYSGATTPHLLWDNNALNANGVGILQNNSLSPFVSSPANPIIMGAGLNYSRLGMAWQFNNISQSTLAGALAAQQYFTTSFSTGFNTNVYTLQNWASYQYTAATWPPNVVVQISTDPNFVNNTTTIYNGSAPFASTGYMQYNLTNPYTLMSGQTYYVRYIPLATTTGNYVMDAFGFNATCAPCPSGTSAPVVSNTSTTNICPTTSVNINSLNVTSTPPAGTRLVWSTHFPPTNISDTLTSAQKNAYTTSETLYALYYSPSSSCYSPADSVLVIINNCEDTDSDGILDYIDIDDDNDGVLDAIETPSCYYTATEINDITNIATGISNASTIANTIDNNPTTTFRFNNAQNLANDTVFVFSMPTYVELDTVTIDMSSTAGFGTNNTAKARLQGWDGSSWVNLSDSIVVGGTIAGGNINFPINQNKGKYLDYRIIGLTGTTSSSYYVSLMY
jgi:hypothetical protein